MKQTRGRLTRDGAAVRRVQVMLDEDTIERAKSLGDGNLSIGLRKMAKEADMNEYGKFESWEEMDDARERIARECGYYSPGEFITPPECGGQIVRVSYGLDADRGAVIVRRQDGGDGRVSYTAYQLPEEWDGEWAPWNGAPTLGEEIGPCGIKA